MPVWHELTRGLRESGQLRVVGLVQEQHPDRAALFAQWQGFEWPILWDPYNLTEAPAVPRMRLIDEHGIVRSLRPDPRSLSPDFLEVEFEAPDGLAPPRDWGARVVEASLVDAGSADERGWDAISRALFGGADELDAAIDVLREVAAAEDAPPIAAFRLGVALRRRYDSEHRREGDFGAALDAWRKALAADPNQYIWRRRIQQYGPRLDKPYPFYDWVETARAELLARGEEPLPVRVALTGSESVARETAFGDSELEEPDPDGRVRRVELDLVRVESAAAYDTSRDLPVARVHVELAPAGDLHWNNEVEPARVWISEVPEGWELEAGRLEAPVPGTATSDERRPFDFEVQVGEGAPPTGVVRGYAVFHACRGEDGECVYRRRDFSVELSFVPGPAGK